MARPRRRVDEGAARPRCSSGGGSGAAVSSDTTAMVDACEAALARSHLVLASAAAPPAAAGAGTSDGLMSTRAAPAAAVPRAWGAGGAGSAACTPVLCVGDATTTTATAHERSLSSRSATGGVHRSPASSSRLVATLTTIARLADTEHGDTRPPLCGGGGVGRATTTNTINTMGTTTSTIPTPYGPISDIGRLPAGAKGVSGRVSGVARSRSPSAAAATAPAAAQPACGGDHLARDVLAWVTASLREASEGIELPRMYGTVR